VVAFQPALRCYKAIDLSARCRVLCQTVFRETGIFVEMGRGSAESSAAIIVRLEDPMAVLGPILAIVPLPFLDLACLGVFFHRR